MWVVFVMHFYLVDIFDTALSVNTLLFEANISYSLVHLIETRWRFDKSPTWLDQPSSKVCIGNFKATSNLCAFPKTPL